MAEGWHQVKGQWYMYADLEIQQYGETKKRRLVKPDGTVYQEYELETVMVERKEGTRCPD